MYVSKLIELSPTLENLDVGDCDLTMGGLMYILGQLQNNVGSPSLKVIDLSRPTPDSQFYQYPPAHMAESVGLVIRVNKFREIFANNFVRYLIKIAKLAVFAINQRIIFKLTDEQYNSRITFAKMRI